MIMQAIYIVNYGHAWYSTSIIISKLINWISKIELGKNSTLNYKCLSKISFDRTSTSCMFGWEHWLANYSQNRDYLLILARILVIMSAPKMLLLWQIRLYVLVVIETLYL